MESEINQKTENKPRTKVSITLKGVPVSVHKRLGDYRRKITAERNKDFTMMDTYIEFLKEMTSKPTA